ncbi:diamine N-acetyltransferase [Saccharicrinis carchari]|uniref:Diamine N-acetyltransferase n=1 Tax=Saccharicrinis carchari TaxID=1168039 RepID=A0A521DI60_SACCC|nr:GNAT family N-acetyltransferase [Saccharicrinis carchari]SMO71275.1 diamine N-acetyltransferase [Saccharicrinis carchari]
MNETVALRAVEPADVDLLYQWENDMELWVYSETLKPFSKQQLTQYLKGINLDIYQSKELRLMIETEGDSPKTVGIIDMFDFDPYHSRAGVGIMVHKAFRDRGYAAMGLDLFIDYCFNTLGIHQLYCSIAVNNKKSIHLFQSKGFIRAGIKKQWRKVGREYIDEGFYQLLNR